MTIWYRAHQQNITKEVFSGNGGLFTAGRWNYRGCKAVYCSESISLCTLEWLAYHGLSVSGFNYYRFAINIPDELINRITLARLPKNWDTTPSSDWTRDFAEDHLFSAAGYLALAVPSVIVPEEYNLVINPLHDAYARVCKTIKKMGKYSAPRR